MKLEIFPYLFSRYASFAARELNQMKFSGGDKYLLTWIEAVKNREQCTDRLCELIYELIKKEKDETQRKILLNLKRAVFNDRNTIANLTDKLSPILYQEIKASLSAFYDSKETLKTFLHDWENIYNEIIVSGRSIIKRLTVTHPFQNGVLLSSKALYQELRSPDKRPLKETDKRAWRTEFSVLRYLTRMTYKTSPFSTLTYLGLTVLSRDIDIDRIHPEDSVYSSIRLNNRLLKRIKGLMEGHNELNTLMYVSLNSSVREEGGKLSYLMNSANIETFQKIQATPINRFIHNLLSDNNQELTLGKLCGQLSDQINANPKEIRAYLLKLVDAGLLELNIRCSEIIPDWENRLLDFLHPHISDNTAASLLFDVVKELQDVKNQFVHADVDKREILLVQVARNLDKALSILEEQAGFVSHSPEEIKALTEKIIEKYRNGEGFEKLPYVPFDYRQESIFYEDTFIKETAMLPLSDIRSITEKLNSLCGRLVGFDVRKPERENMLKFFLKTYGTNGSIPVMDFYQAYYRRKEMKAEDDEPAKEKLFQQADWVKEFNQVLEHSRWDENGIHISFDDLAVLPSSDFSIQACSVFIQFFTEQSNNKMQGVINGLMPGMGKLNGRFLHLFDQDIAAEQRKSNLSLFPDKIMMELNDGSSFNANIHPPLLDYEIKMPASNTLMDSSCQIGINRISVAYQEHSNKLVLIENGSGKEIHAYDLCLETLTNRSNLYQMLSHFNPIPYISYYPVISAVDQHYAQRETPTGIRINPRVTYENEIVLRRKGWVIEKNMIPEQRANESDSIYYLKIKHWLQVHQIPADVFIFLKSSYLPKVDNIEDLTTRDDYKPQYISFDQPFLVKLFKRLIQRAATHLYMEEVLPKVDPSENPSYRVSEHLLQWHQK